MTPYIAVCILILGIGLLFGERGSRSTRMAEAGCITAILTLLSAVRAVGVGIDTTMYARMYQQISLLDWSMFDSVRFEWGYTALCKLLSYLSSDPQLLLIATSILIVVPIGFYVFKTSDSVAFSMLLYVCLFYLNDLSMLRQALAIRILLYAAIVLQEGKSVSFFALTGCAALFHSSALIFLVMYPLRNIEFTVRTLAIYLVITCAAVLGSGPLTDSIASLLGREALYSEQFMGANYFGALLVAIFSAFIALFICNYYLTAKRRFVSLDRFGSFCCHAMMLWMLFSCLAVQVQIYSRVGFYFSIFSIVAVPHVLKPFQTQERRMGKVLMGGLAIAYFLGIGLFRPEWNGAIPYRLMEGLL